MFCSLLLHQTISLGSGLKQVLYTPGLYIATIGEVNRMRSQKTDKDPSLLEGRKSIRLNLGAPHHNSDFSICAKYSPVERTNTCMYVRRGITPIPSIPPRPLSWNHSSYIYTHESFSLMQRLLILSF